LESIILLVLFGIASSVIQTVMKNSKQQKQALEGTHPVKPGVQPIKVQPTRVQPTRVQPTRVQPKKVQQTKAQPTYEARNDIYIGKDLEMSQEGRPTEVIESLVVPNQKEEPSSTPRFKWMEDISNEDLQRSIIMAEVLGKPKALRKVTR
jgi:hypothetical protein